jgi:hypothetical protein
MCADFITCLRVNTRTAYREHSWEVKKIHWCFKKRDLNGLIIQIHIMYTHVTTRPLLHHKLTKLCTNTTFKGSTLGACLI